MKSVVVVVVVTWKKFRPNISSKGVVKNYKQILAILSEEVDWNVFDKTNQMGFLNFYILKRKVCNQALENDYLSILSY